MLRKVSVDTESFQDVLRHPIRRKIILALNEQKNLSYMDLMGAVQATNTGKFNYHLKILADLITKDSNGKYELTGKGQLAAQFLLTFKEKKIEPSSLRMADALLIGFAGFLITLVNPAFWSFMGFASMNVQISILYPLLGFFMVVFGLVVPGFLMWRLAVRRSHSHDSYDLYRAPFLAFIMLLILLVVLLIFHVNIGTMVALDVQRTSGPGWTATRSQMTGTNFGMVLLYGLPSSFLGVALSELGFRWKRKVRALH